MDIKEKFNSLKPYQMVELYILTTLVLFTLFLYKEELLFKYLYQNNLSAVDTEKVAVNRNLVSRSNTQLSHFLNSKAENFNIFFDRLKFQDNILYLTSSGKFEDNLNFIHNLNQHLKLLELKIENRDQKISIYTKYDKNHFFNPDIKFTKLKNIPNPFYEKNKEKSSLLTKKLNLNAIILDNVNINGKWYKKNDIVNNKKIINIKINEIELLNLENNKITKISVYKEL